MADKKISELTALAAGDVASDDLFVVVDVGSSETKKITTANLASALNFTVGNGNVVGPASATNNSVAIFDGTSGELLKSPGSALTFDGTNLGVGTSSPAQKLHLSAASGAIYEQITSGSDQLYLGIAPGVGGTLQSNTALAFYTGSSYTRNMTIDTSGNLLVNTASASGRLTVLQNAVATLAAFNAPGVAQLLLGFNGTSTNYFDGDTTIFRSGGATERARIDSSGNLLVGRSDTTGDKLSVYNGGSTDFVMLLRNDYAGTRNFARFQATGTTVGSITSDGSSTAYNTSSDYRLKNITGPVTNSGAYIDSLNPVEGTWKADGSTFVGLIAHEVQEVSRTRVATGTKDGAEMQAMDYSSSEIIANLIAEVKSLRQRVAQLESN